MATVSPWKLTVLKHTFNNTVWNAEVVKGWFAPDNAESADAFLERAETKSFKGESNGAKILYKVIQVSEADSGVQTKPNTRRQ